MEHPPKQGLKRLLPGKTLGELRGFNGTSTKTRIETLGGLYLKSVMFRFNGTSTKTRIETRLRSQYGKAEVVF